MRKGTGNPLLIFILDFILYILIGIKEDLKPSKQFYRRVLNAHRRIYESIRERNLEKAGKEMAHHVREEEKDLFEIQKQWEMKSFAQHL
jgi:DNA-binding FadR family transcriptional regulator